MADATQAKEAQQAFPAPGILAVLLGASIATFFGRLLSVGMGDLRGAMHLGADAASWIPTWFNMGEMFIGSFSVYLGAVLGPRRVLMTGALLFCACTLVMPLLGNLTLLMTMMCLAGLTAGTFYPLTLAFMLRTIRQEHALWAMAAYAADIVVTVHVAHSYEAWLMLHLSWRWIFWTSTVLTLIMMALLYVGVPEQPLPRPQPGQKLPSWRGFFYASAGGALLYGALDQGIRLDWWHSGTFVGMVAAGSYLLIAAAVRHFLLPNPMINFPFLRRWNTMVMALVLFLFRFFLLGSLLLVPTYLASVQGYSAEQIGPVLTWLAIPQFLAGLLAVYLLSRIDARVILAVGILLVALACILDASLSSAWSGESFASTQLLLAVGEGITFNGLVGALILDALNANIVNRGIDMLTFSAFFQMVRLAGGEIGTVYMQHFLGRRTAFHATVLGQLTHAGSTSINERVLALAAGMQAHASTPDAALGRAAALTVLTVRREAFTMAIGDCFWLIAFAALACLIATACVRSLNLQYKHMLATLRAQRAS